MGKKKTVEYDEAYGLYCDTELTQKEIARIVGVSETQLSRWSGDNNWELNRAAKQVTAQKIIRQWYNQLAGINDLALKEKRSLIPAETDQIIKITNAIEKLNKKYNLQAYHSTLRECLEYMMKTDSEKAKMFGPVMLDFLKYKSNQLQNDKSIG